MKIILFSDFKSIQLKNHIKSFLNLNEIDTIDVGVFNEKNDEYDYFLDFYSTFINYNTKSTFGIIIMKNVINFNILSNRIKFFNSCICNTIYEAKQARILSNCNILCLNPESINKRKSKKIVNVFINTNFNEKNYKSLEKINKFLEIIK